MLVTYVKSQKGVWKSNLTNRSKLFQINPHLKNVNENQIDVTGQLAGKTILSYQQLAITGKVNKHIKKQNEKLFYYILIVGALLGSSSLTCTFQNRRLYLLPIYIIISIQVLATGWNMLRRCQIPADECFHRSFIIYQLSCELNN